MARDTRQRILQHALTVVNERGLEALSIREVARDLGLSPGNVSYHFNKREDLVFALAEPLSDGNHRRFATPPASAVEVLEVFRSVLHHQHAYRGLVLSLPHVMEAFPAFRERYRTTELERRDDVRRMLQSLVEAKELEADAVQIERLLGHVTLISRFWMSEARASFRDEPVDAVVGHYLALLADLLLPYAPRPEELRPYLDGLLVLRRDIAG